MLLNSQRRYAILESGYPYVITLCCQPFLASSKLHEQQNNETGAASCPVGCLMDLWFVSCWFCILWRLFPLPSDPSIGDSEVPVAWPKLTEGHQYVDINNGMDKNSIKQQMRARYVHFWSITYTSFPNVNWKSLQLFLQLRLWHLLHSHPQLTEFNKPPCLHFFFFSFCVAF